MPNAYRYLLSAQSFYEDAKALFIASGSDFGSNGTRYCAHMAIELSLKSYMRHVGFSFTKIDGNKKHNEEVSKNTKHDIQTLYDKCRSICSIKQQEIFPSLEAIPSRVLNETTKEVDIIILTEKEVISALALSRKNFDPRYPNPARYAKVLPIQFILFVAETLFAGLNGNEPEGFIYPQDVPSLIRGKKPKYSLMIARDSTVYKEQYGTQEEREIEFGRYLIQ
mgnify:CR=1 FL=1